MDKYLPLFLACYVVGALTAAIAQLRSDRAWNLGTVCGVAVILVGLFGVGLVAYDRYEDRQINQEATTLALQTRYLNAPTLDNITAEWFKQGPRGSQAAKITDNVYAIRVRVDAGEQVTHRGFAVVGGQLMKCGHDRGWERDCAQILAKILSQKAAEPEKASS